MVSAIDDMSALSANDDGADHSRVNRAVVLKRSGSLERKRELTAGCDCFPSATRPHPTSRCESWNPLLIHVTVVPGAMFSSAGM